MIRFENTEVTGWKAAIRGMRNPLNSWNKSDTVYEGVIKTDDVEIIPGISTTVPIEGKFDIPHIGPNDHSLMMKLRNAGTDHRKFMRMIIVYVDITAPLYWWKEFDIYRFGVEKNSCSTMHTIADKEFTLDDFSHEHLETIARFQNDGEEHTPYQPYMLLKYIVDCLNACRDTYLRTGDKTDWWQMIQLLPNSYNQKRTAMMSYETLANMYHARKNHKQDEWRIFCNEWIPTLPYPELITGELTDSQK